jgi:hypothetical protein
MQAIRPNVDSSVHNTVTCIELPRTAVCLFRLSYPPRRCMTEVLGLSYCETDQTPDESTKPSWSQMPSLLRVRAQLFSHASGLVSSMWV